MRTLPSLLTLAALSLAPFASACATDGADATSDADDESSAPGSFDMWQADDGQWHFHLAAGNGNILLASEAYTDRVGAINGILSMRSNGATDAQYELVPAAHGFLLHLTAGNGQTIGFTEVYATKSSATRAIGSCVRAVTSYNTKVIGKTTGARVAVTQGASGQFHFNVYAKNGQVVLSSESYTSEAGAWNGALSVQDNGVNTYQYEELQGASGFYFNLRAANGEIVGTSQVYTTSAAAKAGRDALVKLLPTIDII